MREWLINGGQLVGNFDEWSEIMDVRYAQELGKVKIMTKKMQKRLHIKSPDTVEALMLTFYRSEYDSILEGGEVEQESFDPFEPI